MEHPLLIVISLISGLNALKWVIMIYKRRLHRRKQTPGGGKSSSREKLIVRGYELECDHN